MAQTEAAIGERIASINAVMRRKLSLLYELYKLSLEEFSRVKADSVEQLGNIIDEKQSVMREIDVLDVSFLKQFSELKSALGVESAEEIDRRAIDDGYDILPRMKENAEEIYDILMKIDAIDSQVNEKLQKLRQDISLDLIRMRKQRLVSTVYSNEKRAPDRGFLAFDKKK